MKYADMLLVGLYEINQKKLKYFENKQKKVLLCVT